MRPFVTLQHSRYRVKSISRVSERVVMIPNQPPAYGFYVHLDHSVDPDWVGYPDEPTAIAVLDDLHKLLDEDV